MPPRISSMQAAMCARLHLVQVQQRRAGGARQRQPLALRPRPVGGGQLRSLRREATGGSSREVVV